MYVKTKQNMKFNNETIREAVKEWLENDESAETKYGHISNWDTSEVTDMNELFMSAYEFNQPIGNWDVSNVANMVGMFKSAVIFNHPLNNWDVSNVTYMSFMFESAMSYNQPLGDWDVSCVTDMGDMFRDAEEFNQSIGNWDVSKVIDMSSMFSGAKAFNQSIGDWNTSSVTDVSYMFSGAEAFNQDISAWNTSSVTNMKNMFFAAESFNQPIGGWNVSKVTDMSVMFEGASSFNESIGNWDVSKVINMSHMFCRAEAFNQSLEKWDFSKVIDTSNMFDEANINMISRYGKDEEKSIDSEVLKTEFEVNGLFFKQNKSRNFVAYHENGNKRIEYLNADINKDYEHYSHLCPKILANKDTKISTYDENGKELKEVTIFLTPNKGDSLIVFKTAIDNYANFHEGNFTETNYLSNYINDRNHIINLTGSNECDLKKYPPVIISVPSQNVLRSIAHFIPDKKFVLIFRWENLSDDDWVRDNDLLEKQIISYDEIWRSANIIDDNGDHLDEEILDFPGSKTMQVNGRNWLNQFCSYYDYLRLYEEEVFNNLEISYDNEENYTEDDIPFEPSLILDVEEYKRKIIFK